MCLKEEDRQIMVELWERVSRSLREMQVQLSQVIAQPLRHKFVINFIDSLLVGKQLLV